MQNMTNTVRSGEHPRQLNQQSIIAYLLVETEVVEKKKRKGFLYWKKEVSIKETKDLSRVLTPKQFAELTPEQKMNCTPATGADIVRYGGTLTDPNIMKTAEAILAI